MRYDVFVNCKWVDSRWQQYAAQLHKNNKQKNTMKQNTQNGTYIKIRIHNLTIRIRNNKNIQFTKLNINTQNIQPYTK